MITFARLFCFWQDLHNVGATSSTSNQERTLLITGRCLQFAHEHEEIQANIGVSDGKLHLLSFADALQQFSAWNPQAVRVAHSRRVYITWGWGDTHGAIERQRREQTESRPAAISLSGNPGLQKPHRRSACSQADRISGFACTNTHCWEKQSSRTEKRSPVWGEQGLKGMCLCCIKRENKSVEKTTRNVWIWW